MTEIDKLREALAFYGNMQNWRDGGFTRTARNTMTLIMSTAMKDRGERARAALAAAPQPAPERESGRAEGWAEAAGFLETLKGTDLDGNEFDLPADEWRVTALLGVRACADKLEAMLARSLRLPSQDDALQQLADLGQQADRAPETMAWAVVGEDGKIDPRKLWINSRDAEEYCEPGERVVRVATRVVEGGDDE